MSVPEQENNNNTTIPNIVLGNGEKGENIDFSIVDQLPPQHNSESFVEQEDDVNEKSSAGNKKGKKKKVKKPPEENNAIPVSQIFRFATPLDKFYIFIGTIAAFGNGIAIPLTAVIFSGFINVFSRFSLAVSIYNSTQDEAQFDEAKNELNSDIRRHVYYFMILGASIFVVSYIQMTTWSIAGANQADKVRRLYYSSLLKQEIAYFDSTQSGELTTRISNDTYIYQEGISEKVGLILQNAATFFGGFIVAFFESWQLTLVLCSVFPLLIAAGAIMAKSVSGDTSKGQDAYAAAGSLAEQVFSNIRTVLAFGGQPREFARYSAKLELVYKAGKRKAVISGIGLSSMMFIIFCSYSLAFWYGSKQILNGSKSSGFSIGNASPHFSSVAASLGSAKKLFTTIDRKPLIDVTSTTGQKTSPSSKFEGRIEFKNISFHYPSRPDVPVLKGFSTIIEPNQTVALVGSSGSGKSTIVGLLERFYDPVEGEILIDGVPLKDWNLKSLRGLIGLVGQEPVLFQNTIRQNIAWGKVSEDGSEVDIEKIKEACKKANAHEFIEDLPKKYDTPVGDKGALLSGGQKQRIAIARALIKDPPILLLDEATSALDTESESLVQDALDNASSNRTTIVIAHRLSTIKNADKIIVMHKGEIKEVENKSTQLRRALTRESTIKSIKSIKEEEEKLIEEKFKGTKTPFSRLFQLNKPEFVLITIGAIASAIDGSIFPVFAILFSSLLDSLAKVDRPKELESDANFYSGIFAIIALVTFFAGFAKTTSFMLSSERLTKRIRLKTFDHLMKQEVAFYDDENNSVGILTSRLAVDATKIEGLTGSLMGNIIQTTVTICIGLGIAFFYGWKLTLVVISAAPIIVIAQYAKLKSLSGYGSKTLKAYEGTGHIVHQSVSNIRTIASLSLEDTFYKLYHESISEPHKTAIKGTMIAALGFGLSQGMIYFFYCLTFWYGSELVKSQEYTIKRMFSVFFVITFTSTAVGQISSFVPSISKARVAALSIFELLDRKPNTSPPDSINDRPTPVTGSSKFDDVHFSYPARPDSKILRGLSMSIPSNKTIAIVGSSGSGKSTVISLLLRYYNANSGVVRMEDIDILQWDLEYLRENLSLVGQEPILFDMTIGENIAYGKDGATQDEIETAAKHANINSFIETLPERYNTRVGEKGAQLSGGQKQRIAIARALIRRPKLLLLDEATSALDSESEKVVQDALDKAAKDRTTITIAHRLSTIQNSDLILVCKKGKVVESGKHFDLVAKKGIYFDLVNKQSLTKNHE
ncbi:13651_t:CDS:2 [Funneliformis mosseae]|uniref:13651_t:CDS:1 n=1 Tax=Funneliformis mosseae TaxID=27381 RepID=A0A9N8WFG7_FUNMO|nr:13651_t:CDS:2 [Funneliformis mosseae]